MKGKEIFRQAQNYAFSYMDNVNERSVFPTDEALAGLKNFVEELPTSTGDSAEIVELLHRYGSPATVAQAGGRFFGFVDGGVIPAGLAERSAWPSRKHRCRFCHRIFYCHPLRTCRRAVSNFCQ